MEALIIATPNQYAATTTTVVIPFFVRRGRTGTVQVLFCCAQAYPDAIVPEACACTETNAQEIREMAIALFILYILI
jgi:hypothetical protein